MKKIYINLLVVGLITVLNFNASAQSRITFEASQMMTRFNFIDSQGTKDISYSFKLSNAYHIGYRYDLDNGLYFQPNIGMRKAGATRIYDETNYDWNFQYFDFRAGIGYMYDLGGVNIYLTASPYFAYLLTANQSLNNENFDIIASKNIKRGDLGLFLSPGTQFKLSNSMSVGVQLDYMLGFKNIETSTNGQKATNSAYGLSVGLSFSLSTFANKSF